MRKVYLGPQRFNWSCPLLILLGSKKSTGLTRALPNNELLLGSRVSKSLYFGLVRFHYYTFCVVIFCSLFRFSSPVTPLSLFGFPVH